MQWRDEVVPADDLSAVQHDPFGMPPAQGAHEADRPVLRSERHQMLEPGCGCGRVRPNPSIRLCALRACVAGVRADRLGAGHLADAF